MKIITLVFEIDKEKYPILNSMSKQELEYYLREGYFVLGNTYDKVPMEETTIEHPETIIMSTDIG